MKPSGSSPSYWNPGRRVIQFGVSRRSESQLWLRQRCASFPRSSTTCSMPSSDRQRLMASPACPAPMMTVVVRGTVLPQRVLTLTSTGTPLVSTSNTAERARDCSTISRSFSGGASPAIVKLMRMRS